MSLNRNRYSSAPLMHMKNKRPGKPQGSEPPVLEAPAAPQKARRFGALQIIMSVGLPVLFLLSLLINSSILRWAFIGLTVVMVGLMWLLRAFVKNARTTLSLIYGLLAVVIAVAIATSTAGQGARQAAKIDTNSLFNQGSALDIIPVPTSGAPSASPSAEAVILSNAQIKLEQFLAAWIENDNQKMLEICRPSWVVNRESPERDLFNLLGLSRPAAFHVEKVFGSDADSSRTIELMVDMQQSSGTPLTKLYQILMVRVNDEWYIDPDSLNSIALVDVTPSPGPGETAQPTASPEPYVSPTPEPTINPGLKLYYNTDGGSYYHLDPNCSRIADKYLPLKGEFLYAEVNTSDYKKLQRCSVCKAPERPSVSAQ